jgi:hypothetical protein
MGTSFVASIAGRIPFIGLHLAEVGRLLEPVWLTLNAGQVSRCSRGLSTLSRAIGKIAGLLKASS